MPAVSFGLDGDPGSDTGLTGSPPCSSAGSSLKCLIVEIIETVNLLVPLLFGIALIAFMWGVIKYIYAADPKNVKDARNFMIFSVIGIAVMLSVWSIASLLKNSIFPGAPSPLGGGPGSSGGGSTTPVACEMGGTYCPAGQVCSGGVCHT